MSGKRNHGLHLVRQDKKRSASFRAGENIPSTGLYRVYHSEHRVSHEVTLRAGEHFPPCRQCQNDVQFQLITQAPEIGNDTDFRIRLYQLDCPAPAAKEEKDDQRIA